MAKKTTQTSGITLPANLSFKRSIEAGYGVMEAVAFVNEKPGLAAALANNDKVTRVPIQVIPSTVRGTIANDSSDAPQARVGLGKKSLESPNIATVEQALLPADCEHLLVATTVRFSGHSTQPDACNSPEFSAALSRFISAYADQRGFETLAMRYLLNMLNGSWLWRNREGFDMEVALGSEDKLLFVTEDDIDMTYGFTAEAVRNEEKRALFLSYVEDVAKALSGGESVLFRMYGFIRLGLGAEVYPSQEFSSDSTESSASKAESVGRMLSKQRLSNGTYVATIHARKIGNAIRTIDTWHGQEGVGPIAAEPFGANTHQGVAYRISGNDLYSYLRKPEELREEVVSGVQGHHHFTVACLIRGGVFGFAEASKKAKAAAAPDKQPEQSETGSGQEE